MENLTFAVRALKSRINMTTVISCNYRKKKKIAFFVTFTLTEEIVSNTCGVSQCILY